MFFKIFVLYMCGMAHGFTHNVQSSQTVATIDHDRIILSNNAFQEVRHCIEKQHKIYHHDLEEREQELRKLETYLRENETKMNTKDFSDLRQSFDTKVEETQKIVAERRKKLDKYYNKVRSQIIDMAMDIIKELCLKKSIQVVIPKSQIIYAIDAIDITEIVMEHLNNKLAITKIPLFKE